MMPRAKRGEFYECRTVAWPTNCCSLHQSEYHAEGSERARYGMFQRVARQGQETGALKKEAPVVSLDINVAHMHEGSSE